MTPTLDEFVQTLPEAPAQIAAQLIGKGAQLPGADGPVSLVYADYVASGRALSGIEDFIRDRILPYYANSHTEASYCGQVMTTLRREARALIAAACCASEDHAVVFVGSGATAGLNRLVHLFGVGPGTTVLIGPYEHHSNILPWRESGAQVIELPEAPCGGPDLEALEAALAAANGPVVGAFSAMSNVTGIVTDVAEVTRRLKAAGARVVWDYAGAGPYLPIDMAPGGAQIDAVVVSAHKFVGGPGASGVMILRRDQVQSQVPTMPGGGTVRFVTARDQNYSADVAAREEGGTPNVIGDLRAALAFAVKERLGAAWIADRNADLARRAMARLSQAARIEMLGNCSCARVPVLSFRVRDSQGGLHPHQLATRMLSDYFGVQARGGCGCAGPYVMRLLGLSDAEAHRARDAVLAGDEMAKPGFVRLNLSYLMSDAEVDAVLSAVEALPALMDSQAGAYECDSRTAIFRRRA